MKFFWQGISSLLLTSLLISWIVCYWFDSVPAVILAITAGSMLAWLFVSSGFISFYMARSKPGPAFHKIFLGSIFGRLTVMTVLLILIFRYSAINRLPFMISLFCGYFIFQIWEVLSLDRLATRKL